MEILVSEKRSWIFFFFFLLNFMSSADDPFANCFFFFSGTGKIVGKNENQAKSFKFIIIFIPLSLIMQ